ncbi:DUF1566 domain-containing protein [Trichlorobacter lovleyi]|uniref:Lcl domain-containing protein n=1 Tax=Trichlorobacter lovleyi TaxID=313985 RepID=UPI00223F4ABA|nr:DUF1566 domain-containing protein [Trichlorobacter lovleyi]QOX79605.1 DUF1566 domain-containing protein [Trichlorobacter lovleyi]
MLKHAITVLLLAFSLFYFPFCICTSLAAPAPVPATGQTSCYNTAGSEIPCSGTGQDGDLQVGVVWPDPRFTDNGNGTITDNLTGLVWLKDADCFGSKPWLEATFAADALASGACGLSDGSTAGQWHLPRRRELKSLVNRGQVNNSYWLDTQGFTNVGIMYWSSSSLLLDVNDYYGWKVFIFDGIMRIENKANSFLVWPVRGGPGVVWPDPRFTDNGNGTITDNLTGLIWLKNTNCTDSAGGVDKNSGSLSWANALTWSNNLTSGLCGLTDGSTAGQWRLPNVDELESLIDTWLATDASPLDRSFSNLQRSEYWSSSTYLPLRNNSFYVSMLVGEVDFNSKDSNYYVWPVRSVSSVISVVPGSKDFGSVGIGSSSGQVITISNPSRPDNLSVYSLGIDGPDINMFLLDTGDGSNGSCGPMPIIAGGGGCTVTVYFVPLASGVKTAVLNIASSAPAAPLKSMALTGNGVDLTTSSLILTMAGTGNGVVYSDPVGLYCTDGTCLAEFVPWTTVVLQPVPDNDSTFELWSQECNGSAGCSLLMSANRYVTANFNQAPKARVDAVGYDTLTAAYTGSTTGAEILAREVEFQEDWLLNRDIVVAFKGGFNAAFSTNTGFYTTLAGSLTIGNGSLSIENLLIK